MITSLRHRMHQDLQLAGLAEGTHAIGGHPPQDGMRQGLLKLRLSPRLPTIPKRSDGWPRKPRVDGPVSPLSRLLIVVVSLAET
jgi:hypothetical protein